MDENKNESQNVSRCSKERTKRLVVVGLSALVGAFLGSYFVMSQVALNQNYHHKCFKHRMMMNQMMHGDMMNHAMMPQGAVMPKEDDIEDDDIAQRGSKAPVVYIVMPEEIHVENGRHAPFERRKK